MHSNSAKEQHYSYQSINNPIFPTPLPIQSGTTYGPPSQLKMMNNTLKKHTQSNPKETEKKKKTQEKQKKPGRSDTLLAHERGPAQPTTMVYFLTIP
jgi:hypothetical protein